MNAIIERERSARVREFNTVGVDLARKPTGVRRRHVRVYFMDSGDDHHHHIDDGVTAYVTVNQDGSIGSIDLSWLIDADKGG